jgi:hypothetical protein
MGKRETPPWATTDFLMFTRSRIGSKRLTISFEQDCPMPEEINLWVGLKILDLSFKSLRIGNVISIHPGNIFSSG